MPLALCQYILYFRRRVDALCDPPYYGCTLSFNIAAFGGDWRAQAYGTRGLFIHCIARLQLLPQPHGTTYLAWHSCAAETSGNLGAARRHGI